MPKTKRARLLVAVLIRLGQYERDMDELIGELMLSTSRKGN